jgi:hypothetical protein
MKDILLSHYLETARIRATLMKMLGSRYDIVAVSPDGCVKTGLNPEYLIASLGGGCEISAEHSIIVLSGSYACPRIKGNATIILDSREMGPCFSSAEEARLLPISCGRSSKDTLTLSSITSDSAVVSLQRPVVTQSGAVVEQADYPISIEGSYSEDPFRLLAVTAVLILTDNGDMILNTIF